MELELEYERIYGGVIQFVDSILEISLIVNNLLENDKILQSKSIQNKKFIENQQLSSDSICEALLSLLHQNAVPLLNYQ